MSISEPETPRPQEHHSPTIASAEKMAVPPDLIRRGHQTLPSRPEGFSTTTFPSNPAGPVRRRRTESFFSFEMGPSFSSTKQLHELCNLEQTNDYKVQLHAKMDRGFFKAELDWTCYRRNYFQVSATFDMHGTNYILQGPEAPCLLRKADTGEILPVDYFSIGIHARVANHDKKIELVQHTPKRDKGPQMIPQPRPVRAGGNLHMAAVGTNHNIVTFERLQFKTATANNGKRRAAQQYYEIVVDLYANLSRGEAICVATCHSAPLVVRGRSPGHYADSHTRFKGSEDAFASPPHRFASSMPNSPTRDFGPYHAYPFSLGAAYPPPPPPPPPPIVHPSSNVFLPYQQNNTANDPNGANVYFSNSSVEPPVYDTADPYMMGARGKMPVNNSHWAQPQSQQQDRFYDPYGRQEDYSSTSTSTTH
ncbi:p53-like transcription factor [Rhizopus microsporus ATCC 52813]|uniref:p53-like transcription factor n=2 Tax=Rhizopus microsporus TaxID=58291 RepID=A0A2G4SVI4_RHIZD|nr:p53-like transcription factor [Rhizopus microsporus ATCC 52813]PHZ12798.1 p53-like transcription factor [Rhizopus microsporus ATCC 52813]